MKVTKIKIDKIEKRKLKGIASIILDDCLAIHRIQIIEGKNRLFVSMPDRKKSDGRFSDIVHPINQEFRQYIETVILEEFNR